MAEQSQTERQLNDTSNFQLYMVWHLVVHQPVTSEVRNADCRVQIMQLATYRLGMGRLAVQEAQAILG